jgi:hypothetical protein
LSVRGVEALLQAGEVRPALAPPDQFSVGVELFEAVTIRMSLPRRPRGIGRARRVVGAGGSTD